MRGKLGRTRCRASAHRPNAGWIPLEAEHRQATRSGFVVLRRRDGVTVEESAAWQAEHEAKLELAEMVVIIHYLGWTEMPS